MPSYWYDGRVYHLGARPKNFDAKELKYRLAVPERVDYTTPIDLSPHFGATFDQQTIGSCTANAIVKLMMVLGRLQGADPPMLCRLLDYYRSRVTEGTFPNDDGAYVSDAADAALLGLPAESAWPYVADAAAKPPAALDTAPVYDYMAAHQPWYATDQGGIAAGAITALSQQKPFVIGIMWHRDWFDPPNGVIEWRDPNGPGWVGGHCVCFGKYRPKGGGSASNLFGLQNSWGDGYPFQRNPELPKGWAYMTQQALETAMEARAASPEPVAPQPAPAPEPQPTDRFTEGYAAALQVALVTEADALAYARAKPSSVTRKWWSLGAQWSRFAIQNNAPAGMPGATGEGKQPR